jgi:hypothetical protein
MKPGEFVRWNGRSVRALMIQCRYQDGYEAIIGPDSPDYALAVAALQSLIRPSMDPMAGRVLAMREEGDGPHEWRAGGVHYRWNEELQRVEVHKEAGGWEMGWNHPSQAFEAGRRYERERG